MNVRVAVIANPARVDVGRLRVLVGRALAEHGGEVTTWLETTVEDPGPGQAQAALGSGANRVLVAGGDGTVRAVLGELAGTGVPVGILPSGTGSVLARNLGIPSKLDQALRTALTGIVTALDLFEVTTPDGVELAAVLGGVGMDANILAHTSQRSKLLVGILGYVGAGIRNLKPAPFHARLTLDGITRHQEVSLVAVGNVASLYRGVTIMPGADPRDGLLDVIVASPKGRRGVLGLIAAVLLRREPRLERAQVRELRVEIDGGALLQLDGDVIGRVDDVTFKVLRGAARVVVARK